MTGGQAAVTQSDQDSVIKPLIRKAEVRQHTLDCTHVYRDHLKDCLNASLQGHAYMPRQTHKRMIDRSNTELTE